MDLITVTDPGGIPLLSANEDGVFTVHGDTGDRILYPVVFSSHAGNYACYFRRQI